MAHLSTLAKLAALAEDQWGLLTRRQIEAAGVSRATITRLAGRRSAVLERVAHGVYRLAGAPPADHLPLRAAWLQLDAATPAWRRSAAQGVVSHRSAAALYGFGDLAADRHEFTLPERRQTRRRDVRLHRRLLRPEECAVLGGLPLTLPARIAADLLRDRQSPDAVAQLVADAIRAGQQPPDAFAAALAPHAERLGAQTGAEALGVLLEGAGAAAA